jgi:hypothetical protein
VQPRNPYLCLTIVGFIGVFGAIAIAGMVALCVVGRPIDPSIVGVAIGSLGSLSSFLVSVPRGSMGGGVHSADEPPIGPKATGG